MKTHTIQTRKWITTCLMALLTFCLVFAGMLFIAPIEAEAATFPQIYFDDWDDYFAHNGQQDLTETTYDLEKDMSISNFYNGYRVPSGKNVTVNGNGYTIYVCDESDAYDNNLFTLFKVENSATLTLDNVNIVVKEMNAGSTSTIEGVRIVSTGLYSNVTMNNCVIDSAAHIGTTSAVVIEPTATFTANATTFKNWHVNKVNVDAVISNKGLLTIKGCKFNNCGAIPSVGDTEDTKAGAIYQYGTTTYEDGGNSYSYKARMYISEGTEFLGCQGYDAGAIFIADGGLENYITDTTFSDCVSDNNGGALTVGVTDNGTHIYGNVVFQDNRTFGKGGAIYGSNMWIGRQGTSRVTIKDNSARTYGGGIAAIDKVYLGRVDVTGNTAGRDDADYDWLDSYTSGGGIYTEGLFAVTSTTNISNNQSIGYGGGIYVTSTGTLQIEYMPYIDGNTNTNNEASDIYLSHNADSGASAKIKIINSLHKTADSGTMAVPIGLRVGKTGTAITTGWANAAQAISDVFVSEVSGKALYVNDSNELYVDTGYLVTIDPNDGATTGTSGYMASITWADTASYRPSRTGYTFKGWTTKKDDASTLVLSASNTTYTPTANVTLYGLWEKHTYSITYKLNGGAVEGWTPSNFTASYGDSYMLVPNTTPTRSGYTFTGWTMTYYGLKNGGALGNITIALPEEYIGAAVPFEEPDGITQASITITANWTERTVSSIKITDKKYTVQSYFVGDELKSFNITVTYDNNETAKVTVTESMVSNFSTATTTGAKTATITYGGKTATFTYTVSAGYAYKVEHYQENADDDEYTLVSADTQTLYGVGTTEATAKTYTGFTAQSFEQQAIAEDGSTVVKIYYTRNVYTITFNMQGGNGGTTEVTVKHGQTNFSGLVPPTKAGYTFNGYYTQMNGGGKRWFDEDMAEEVPDTTANATVYAYWTERMVERIEIPAASQNQSYVAGDAFVPFNITVTYDNGETETVQVTASMLDNFSTESAVTSATATVTHMGKTATFTYTVAARKYNLTYNVNGATGTGPLNQEVAEGTKVYLPSAGGLTKTGYTFGYWMYGDQILRVGDAFTMPADDVEIVAYWALNKPTLAGTAGGALNYTYKGSAYNVTVNPSHVLGNEVSYTFRWFRLNEGETNINSLYFSKDDLFEERCELLTTSSGTYGSYSFTNVVDSGVYYCVVTVTHGENTSQTAVEYTVSIAKVDQTITLSENEFTYSEGLTIDFADYVDGTGDGTLSFEVSDKNGVAFDFANGVVSNITEAGGTFTLTVNKAASDNYNAATETFTVTLNKGTQTLSVSGSPNPPTWKQEYQVSVSGNKGALSYAIISGNATVNESGVITATGTGQIRYSVTAAATNLYEAVTVERTVTFGKAAGNLAPDYATSKPTDLTICVGKTTDNITLPTGWSFASKTTFGQVGNITVSVTFTPSDTANYNSITENIVIAVADHTGGTAASCTSDQTCTKCGDVLVEALGHNYTEQVDNTVRTTAQHCQECNTYWYDCSRCGASAKNDANATDKWYTSTEAGEHKMSSDWTSENGQHFHKCTVSGCDHTDTKVKCTGGMPTCVSPAICSVCQNPYGSVTAHHFYDTSEWGYKGTDGHAHVCEYCGVHDTVVGHTPNVSAATEETAKYCTVCDFVIEQQLNHVHSEGTEWKYDSEHHWHDCVGNDGQVYSKAEHTYDNACDTTCNVCNATRTITHDYSKLEKNDTEHWYVCSVCGSEKANSRTGHSGGTKDCQHKAECATCGQIYGDFGDHAYDTTVWVSVDNEHHAHKCRLCDAYTDATDHYSADEATCTEDRLCDACGHKMEDAHGHSYTKQIESPVYLKAEGEDCQSHHTYYYACVRCDASSKDDTNESFEGLATGAHKMSATWTTEYAEETNAGWHYHACTVDGCDYREDEGGCHGGERTCIALAICSTCQKAYGEYAEHSFGNTWEYKDATGHAHVCTVKGCNEHDEIKAHTPNIPAATEESAQYCTACQYQMAAQLNHTHSPATEWTSNATHHWKACGGCDEHLEEAPHSYDPNNACDTTCEVCNAVREVSHDFTGEWEKDASGHWHVCTKNGCSVTDTKQNHVSAGAATETDPEVCSICGWQIAPALGHTTHTPEAEWQKNETHHWHECTGCDDQELDKAAHEYDNNCDTDCNVCGAPRTVAHDFTGEWQKDASGHWHVCATNGCSVTDTKQNHESAGAATETNPEVCSVCGWVINPALGHTTHTPETEWQKDDTYHWHECAGCEGQELEKAAHNDGNSDGSCDTCGYAMGTTPPPHTHSHGTTWVTDANEHWNECECGDKANKAAHVDGNSDGKCDTCNYELGTSTPIDPDPPVDPGNDDDGLGTGAIIAIVVAAVAVVGGGGFAIFWFVIRKRRR